MPKPTIKKQDSNDIFLSGNSNKGYYNYFNLLIYTNRKRISKEISFISYKHT